MGFLGDSVAKNPLANAGDMVQPLSLEDSPGGGNSNPLQYSSLENPMNRGAWKLQSTGSQSQTGLSN